MVLTEDPPSKGFDMLIRGEMTEVRGKRATAARPGTISLAPLSNLLLGELLLLIGP